MFGVSKLGCGLIAALLALGSVRADDEFESKVRPILVDKCLSCHGQEKQKAGLRLDSKPGWQAGGENGPAIVPGKPAESLLIKAVRGAEGVTPMPPKGKLTDREVAVLTKWVKDGATDPRDGGPVRSGGIVLEEAKKWWAFQPVKQPAIPKSAFSHPIDAFLSVKLAERKLTPAPAADKRTLIRRVTFDLVGLPPTPHEIENFVNDNSPEAFTKVVDRLLASPHYGERWGRRWLDIARYADSNGMDENLAYVNSWRYRDWVIQSFNVDKPYDEFVRNQIAGDLIPGGTDAQRAERLTATGLFVIGPKMLAEDDPVKMRMDIVDEQLDTIGQAFMGLTLGCARCHDHKFDPITAADYYGLAGILYSTKSMKNYQVVAAWNERPVGTSASIQLFVEHEKKLNAARADVTAAEKALKLTTAKRLDEERKRATEYANAAAEIHSRSGELKLVVADPSQALPEGGQCIEAEAFARGNVLKLTDGYGAGIGVIINAGPLPNYAEYDIEVPNAGTYQLAVRYAAADARPVRISVGGRVVASEACGSKTGSWNPESQKWFAEAVVTLKAGKAVVRFERNGPFPHLDTFALLPMTAEQIAATPLTVEQVATERKLLASVLREWNRVITGRKGTIPTVEELDQLAESATGPFRNSAEVQAETHATQSSELVRLREKLTAVEKSRPQVDEVMAVEDATGQNLRVHLRGNHLTLGDEIPRRFPQILSRQTPVSFGTDRSGRMELADWLVSRDHPLTARVMANRIWAGHFGAGLVRTPDNFGRLGDQPTHPELLDWLAAEFVRANWSVKHLHRLIVTSAAYQMRSQPDPSALNTDPDNKLLSHFSRRRLDAEEIRDGMLAVSGLLDRKMGGTMLKATPRQYVTSTASRNYDGYAVPRRSVYLPVVRSAVYDVLQTLDFPDPSVPNGRRTATTTPSQALLMLNSALADQTATAFAKSVLEVKGDETARAREAYRRAFGRIPTPAELEMVVVYLKKSEASADAERSSATQRLDAWRGLCRVLLASNEFVFVE